MSGIVIDVDTRSESTKKDLGAINRSLAKIISSSKSSKDALGKISSSGINGLKTTTNSVTKSFKALKDTSSSALSTVDKSAQKADKSVNKVRNTVLTLAAAFLAIKGVSVFSKMADNMTNLENRLKIVVKETEKLVQVQEKLYKISRETRSDFAITASTYVDFVKGLEKTAISETRILNVIRTIQKASILSGSSQESIRAGMIQLQQGIASGTLRGEELNSVLEQMKYLGQGLMSQLDMNAGSLRKFAEEGKLTTEVLINAVEKMSERTARDFKDTNITIAQAASQLKLSISVMLGNLQNFLGTSQAFANRLVKIADTIDRMSISTTSGITLLNLKIKNFIDGLSIFSAAQLTTRAMIKLDITPFEILETYQSYRKYKQYLNKIKDFLSYRSEMEIKPKLKFNLTASNYKNQIIETKDTEKQLSPLENFFLNLKELVSETVNFIKISISNLLRLIPVLQTPVTPLLTKIRSGILETLADLKSSIFLYLVPIRSELENFKNAFFAFATGDMRLENAWVSMFRSKSLDDFVDKLKKLNKLRSSYKMNDKVFLGKEIYRDVIKTTYALQDFLISIGILQNKLIGIRQARVDRFFKYFTNAASAASRVLRDVIEPVLYPIYQKFLLTFVNISKTIIDILYDTFSPNLAIRLSNRLADGFEKGWNSLFKGMEDLESGKMNFGNIFDDSELIQAVTKEFIKISRRLLEFFKIFISNLGSQISTLFKEQILGNINSLFDSMLNRIIEKFKRFKEKLSGILENKLQTIELNYALNLDNSLFDKMLFNFHRMFQKIREITKEVIPEILEKIKEFSNKVNGYFYEIYDKIVGHSYWPDTIDGILKHTDRLKDSETKVRSFKDRLLEIFSGIKDKIRNLASELGGNFEQAINALLNVNLADSFKVLSKNVGAALMAGFMLFFGNTKAKMIGTTYLFSVFNGALNNAFSYITPMLAKGIGTSGGLLADHVVKGFFNALNSIVIALPGFFKTLFKEVVPGGNMLLKIFNIFPMFHNKLLYALAGLALGYAKFAKGGSKTIFEILFGKSATKKGPATEGILSYVREIFRIRPARGVTDPFWRNLFVNKTAAKLAALSFSSVLIESISFLEAATVGTPLLLFALLGKDGGAKASRVFFVTAEMMIGGLYKLIANKVSSVFGNNSKFTKVVNAPFNLLNFIRRPKSNELGKLSTSFVDDAKTLITNFKRNSDKWAKGELSAKEAFTTIFLTDTLSGVTIPFQGFKQEITDFFNKDLGKGITLAGLWIRVKESTLNVFNRLTTFLTSGTLKQAFIRFAEGTGGAISKVFASSTNLIADGWRVLVKLIMNKWSLIALFTIGFASVARAAVDVKESVSDISSGLKTLLKVVGSITIALIALGYAFKLVSAFQMGMGLSKAFFPEKSQFSHAIEGFRAVGQHVAGTVSGLINFGKSTYNITKNKLFNKSWWTSIGGAFSDFLGLSDGTKGNFSAVFESISKLGNPFKDLKGNLSAVKEIGVNAFAALVGSSRDITKNIKNMGKGVKKVFEGVGTALWDIGALAFSGLGSIFKRLGVMLLKFLAPILGIVAAVSGVGVIGLWLFGPADTFFGNLEWAYDKIRGIFGLAPKTTEGKFQAFAKELGQIRVGNEIVDFRSMIDKIDFKQIDEAHIPILLGIGKEAKEGLKNLNELYVKQGYVLDTQLAEQKKLEEQVRKTLGRQPQKEEATHSRRWEEFSKDIIKVDNSLWTLIKRALGWTPELRKQTKQIEEINKNSMKIWSLSGSEKLDNSVRLLKKSFEDLSNLNLIDAFNNLGFSMYNAIWGSLEFIFLDIPKWLIELGQDATNAIKNWGWVDELTLVFKFISDKYYALFNGKERINQFKEGGEYLVALFQRKFNQGPSEEQLGLSAFGSRMRRKTSKELAPGVSTESYFTKEGSERLKKLDEEIIRKSTELYGYNKTSDTYGLKQTERDPELYRDNREHERAMRILKKEITKLKADYERFVSLDAYRAFVKFESEKINTGLENLNENTKKFWNIDLGEKGSEFLGSSYDFIDWEKEVKFAQQLRDELKEATNFVDRRYILGRLDVIFREMTHKAEKLKTSLNRNEQIEFELKIIGERKTKETISRLKLNGGVINYRIAFDKLDKAKSALDSLTANDSPEKVRDTNEIYKIALKNFNTMAPTTPWLDDINNKLKSFQLTEINMSDFIKYDPKIIKSLAQDLDKVTDAFDDYTYVLNVGSTYDQQIDAMDRYLRKLREVSSKIEEMSLQQLKDINSMPFTDPLAKTFAIMNKMGQDTTGLTLDRSDAEAYNKLLISKAEKTNQLKQIKENPSSPLGFSAETIQKELNEIEKKLTKFTDKSKLNLDSLVDALSSIDDSFNKKKFLSLKSTDQETLLKSIKKINDLNRENEDKSATSPEAQSNAKLILEEENNLRKLLKTYRQLEPIRILNLFEDSGFDINERLLNADASLKDAFINSKLQAEDYKKNMEDGLGGSLEGYDRVITISREAEVALKNSILTPEERLSKINEAFSTEFKLGDLQSDVILNLSAQALDILKQLEDFKNGKTELDIQVFNSKVEKDKFNINKQFSDLPFDKALKNFDTTPLDVIVSKILELVPGLSDIEELLSKSKDDIKLLYTGAIEIEREKERNKYRDTPVPLKDMGENLLENILNFIEQKDPLRALSEKSKLLGKEISKETQNYLDEFDTPLLSSLVNHMRYQKSLLNDPKIGQSVKNKIQKDFEILEFYFANAIEEATFNKQLERIKMAKESGQNFSNSIQEGMKSGLFDLIKGEKDVQEFVQDIVKTYTDNVLQSFVNGLVDAVMGQGSTLDKSFKNLGGTLFSMSNKFVEQDKKDPSEAIENNTEKLIENANNNNQGLIGNLWNALATNLNIVKDSIISLGTFLWNGLKAFFVGNQATGESSTLGTIIGGIGKFFGSSSNSEDTVTAATGGLIRGMGTATSDSIPAMLSNGEFVINAKSTKRYRNLLEAINNGSVRGFAEGGIVKPSIPTFTKVDDIAQTGSNFDKSIQTNTVETVKGFNAVNNTLQEGFDNLVAATIVKDMKEAVAYADSIKKPKIDWIGLTLAVVGAIAGAKAGASTKPADPQLVKAAVGGFVKGPGTNTSDSISARLSNGEFVINANATKKNRALLESINSNKKTIRGFAEGGYVGDSILTQPNFNDSSNVSNKKESSSQVIKYEINVTGDVSRQTRKEIMNMIPNIASGVNLHNRNYQR
jgi:tape measure domain-containing protein